MSLTPDELVRALRTVPEKRLRILELARELANEKGELDLERAAARADEVEMADREASAYAQATRNVLRWLTELAR
jgi:hypothetical protein